MPTTEIALTGTAYLSPVRHTAFYDRYQTQYAQTLAWLQQALGRAATARDLSRRTDASWLAEKRRSLAQYSGFDQLTNGVTQVARTPAPAGATAYTIQTEAGLLYTGLFWEPATAPLRGAVLVAGENEGDLAQRIAHYLAQGLRVILPCLARPQHSFADHPERKWFYFTDDELLHLLFFIVGGSLAGLEAAELLTVCRALAVENDQPLPVAFDLGERHTLTAAVTAALASGATETGAGGAPVQLLVLPENVAYLDQQAEDVRLNLIWNFHTYFDALTLWQMAEKTNLLFIEPTVTPSSSYSRALAWFGAQTEGATPERSITRLVTPLLNTLAVCVAAQFAPGATTTGEAAPLALGAAMATLDELYQRALASKLAYLEATHEQARQQRQGRYALTTLTPDEYRQRIAASLERVAGPLLPASPDRRPQSRHIRCRGLVDTYEIVLESVPGVEVAGYLLIPQNPQPAPAIICQHGLGGRPEALVGIEDRFEDHQWVYDRFAIRLAERGYVVFVPFMNWGWPKTTMRDRLVKHAYALGFAPNQFEVAQLHAIVDFLQARPEVMPERIAFYGLSYGGHASVWLCAQEPRLAAVVTAGHFNDWQTKLTSTELSPPLVRPTSYVTVDEGYDMFNYNVLRELGHAELVTRFAPRPQMVENGLRDAVTPTAWVNREFARVQAVFTWLDAADQVELEHFDGPHRIWAEGSFRFLQRHLVRGLPKFKLSKSLTELTELTE